MRVIPLVTVDDTAMVSSNVPEDDYAAYAGGTTYDTGDRARTTDHRIFQSAIDGNIGNDPTDPANVVSSDNPSAPWIYVSKTNRWRAFDGLNSAKTRQATSITYELLVSRTTEVVALTGLEGASVQVEVVPPIPIPAVYGPELIVNGTFDTDFTNWTQVRNGTASVSAGQVSLVTPSSPGNGGIAQGFPTTVGDTYFVQYDLISSSSGNTIVAKSDHPTSVQIERVDIGITSTPGTYSGTFVATASTSYLYVLGGVVGSTAVFDNASVKREIIPERTVVFDETRQLLDTSNVQTYFQYFTFEADEYVDAAVFYPVGAFSGYTINITITAVSGGDAAVAIIGYGRRRVLGQLLVGTTPNIEDYSTKEVNVFGERIIVPRAYAREIEFKLAIPTPDYSRVERILIPLRATPAIYYESEELKHNLIVSGIFSDFSPPLDYAMTFATLTILGDI